MANNNQSNAQCTHCTTCNNTGIVNHANGWHWCGCAAGQRNQQPTHLYPHYEHPTPEAEEARSLQKWNQLLADWDKRNARRG